MKTKNERSEQTATTTAKTYSEWKSVTTTELKENLFGRSKISPKYHFEAGKRPHLGGTIRNPPIVEVSHGEDVVRTMATIEPEVFTDFDGKVNYGDWKTRQIYEE